MLRAGTVKPVRQEKNEPGLAKPFGLGAHQVLINNELGRIVEIAKLSFP